MVFLVKSTKKQPAQTRQAILETAGAGFSQKGYASTGIVEIVTLTQLTKGALFHHFPDKQSLALAWVKEILTPKIDSIWLTPLLEISSLPALKRFCHTRCLELEPGDATSALIALCAELQSITNPLGEALESLLHEWRAGITQLLERGKSAQWIHHSIQPENEAAFLISAFAGFTITTSRDPQSSMRKACSTALDAYLETLRAE